MESQKKTPPDFSDGVNVFDYLHTVTIQTPEVLLKW